MCKPGSRPAFAKVGNIYQKTTFLDPIDSTPSEYSRVMNVFDAHQTAMAQGVYGTNGNYFYAVGKVGKNNPCEISITKSNNKLSIVGTPIKDQ